MSPALTKLGTFEEQRQEVANFVASLATLSPVPSDGILTEVTAKIRAFFHDAATRDGLPEGPMPVVHAMLDSTFDVLRLSSCHRSELRKWIRRSFGLCLLVPSCRVHVRRVDAAISELADVVRTAVVNRPDWGVAVPTDLEELVWTVRVPPLAYLRAMWNLFWSATRHPLSETTIDLSTGRVLYRT